MYNRFCLLLLGLLCSTAGFSQNGLPDVKVKDLKGNDLPFSSLFEKMGDTPVIVSFWATWCGPCIKELEAIDENMEEWLKTTTFKVFAVSIDDSRTSGRVKSFIKGRGWTFPVFQDINNDLKRALNIPNVPHTLIVRNQKIVYQHDGYLPGNEEELIEKVRSKTGK
jgi:cytochrome c biogenesis protein CcmG, thiol:disulfide interchange protein DsbE